MGAFSKYWRGSLFVLVFVATACGEPNPAPLPVTPPPTVAPESTATALPAETATPEPAPTDLPPLTETEFQSHLTNYSITIPQEWRVIDPRSSDIEALFATLDSSENESTLNALETFREAEGVEQVDFIAKSATATWTVVVAPRNGLTLEDYLTITAGQLGDSVQRRGINTTLRDNGIPAAVLHIVDPQAAGGPITYQVIHYDERAENLIIHSFAALSADLDRLRSEFNRLVKSVVWN